MFKLGKNGKKHDYRTLQYNKYNQNVTITVPQNFGHQDIIYDGQECSVMVQTILF
jgi:hypothetical protein